MQRWEVVRKVGGMRRAGGGDGENGMEKTGTGTKNEEGKIVDIIGGEKRETDDGGIVKIGVDFRYRGKTPSKGGGVDPEIFENLVWMTSAEAAKYLRKSYGALRVMVCRGYIKPRMFHRRWYFRRSELDRLIENSF